MLLLFGCRFLQGAVSGVVFSVGTAWLAELIGEPARSARLTTAALGGGWALGPLTSGLLAQWAPAPTVLPYLVHVALTARQPAAAARGPGDAGGGRPPGRRAGQPGRPGRSRWAFWLVVLPIAVGVFTFPSTAVTVLPLLLTPTMPQIAVAITGLVAGVTLLTGVFAQPLGRRLGRGAGRADRAGHRGGRARAEPGRGGAGRLAAAHPGRAAARHGLRAVPGRRA